ncbi:radical SAM protein [Gloeothece verrucosa]|uniref:Radical SAM domain protein n=1 Tax=Gloeothece verrucosa (strain PCC 7822) TaxID=497965 RepID=E0UAZ5_GLOV7|nr:radical SAM protein [Gloeothece verrucosa]ADN15117.1 Radical SAM domain protein [Gloeothece verrucosa PCC 7822]
MLTESTAQFTPVYGPVKSWRYGRSLGIDPIGKISSCSFNCVYCQLGEIEQPTGDRALFVATSEILDHLKHFAPWDVEVITLSGSGEPTLALNLGEILREIKALTGKPTLVLTNGTLLTDAAVRSELAHADKVSLKLDAVNASQLKRINRPIREFNLAELVRGIKQFREQYKGELSIQTMVLVPWDDITINTYIELIKQINPKEIQLNTPKRPKPLQHQLEARGNHTQAEERFYPVQVLKCVSATVLEALATRIAQETQIAIKCA